MLGANLMQFYYYYWRAQQEQLEGQLWRAKKKELLGILISCGNGNYIKLKLFMAPKRASDGIDIFQDAIDMQCEIILYFN